MIYGSVCAGIEAAKQCTQCLCVKDVTAFHRQGKNRRHSWCKDCFNSKKKKRTVSPINRRRNLLSSRYGITDQQFKTMLDSQNGLCAICGLTMKRVCIDHNHETRKVRGLLCHGCNIKLPAVEDKNYHDNAVIYLGRHNVS